MIEAIGKSLVNRGETIKFVDHYRHTLDSAKRHSFKTQEYIHMLGLIGVHVYREGSKVTIRTEPMKD